MNPVTDFIRRDQSPKSSPRGSRSPVVPRQDSTGTLKTTISLGKNPSIVHSGPFYLMKEPPCMIRVVFVSLKEQSNQYNLFILKIFTAQSEITGATNLMQHYGLEHSFNKF